MWAFVWQKVILTVFIEPEKRAQLVWHHSLGRES